MMMSKEDREYATDAMSDVFHYVVLHGITPTAHQVRDMFIAQWNYNVIVTLSDYNTFMANTAHGWPTTYNVACIWNEVLEIHHVPPSSPLYLDMQSDIIRTTQRPTDKERIQHLEVRTTALENRMNATADAVGRLADKVEVLTSTAHRTADTLTAVSSDVQRMADSMAVLVAELKTDKNATT